MLGDPIFSSFTRADSVSLTLQSQDSHDPDFLQHTQSFQLSNQPQAAFSLPSVYSVAKRRSLWKFSLHFNQTLHRILLHYYKAPLTFKLLLGVCVTV